MKLISIFAAVLLVSFSSQSYAKCNNLLDYEAKKLRSSETVNLCESYQGKVILAVNTASKCGYTKQFKELEALYQRYKDQGLEIVGFPSNDFKQEYTDEAKAAEVCYVNYGVTFQMMAPSSVKGPNANAFFAELTKATNTAPRWNFSKYIIDRNGNVVDAYASKEKPLGGVIEDEIKKALEI